MKKELISVLMGMSMLAAIATPAWAEETDGLSGEIHVASWNASGDALAEIGEKFMEENPGTTIIVDKVDAEYTK